MKKFSFLVVLSVPFLLMSCNGSSSRKPKVKVSSKDFVTKLASNAKENDILKGEGLNSSKEAFAKYEVASNTYVTVSGTKITLDPTKMEGSVNAGLDIENKTMRVELKSKETLNGEEKSTSQTFFAQQSSEGFVEGDATKKTYSLESDIPSFEDAIKYINKQITSFDLDSYVSKVSENSKLIEMLDQKFSFSIVGSAYLIEMKDTTISYTDIFAVINEFVPEATYSFPFDGDIHLNGKISLNLTSGKESANVDIKATATLTANKEAYVSADLIKLQSGDTLSGEGVIKAEASIKPLSSPIKPIDLSGYTKI